MLIIETLNLHITSLGDSLDIQYFFKLSVIVFNVRLFNQFSLSDWTLSSPLFSLGIVKQANHSAYENASCEEMQHAGGNFDSHLPSIRKLRDCSYILVYCQIDG